MKFRYPSFLTTGTHWIYEPGYVTVSGMMTARKIDEIEWASWNPQQKATLLFVMQNRHLLLIHKKRGLGAGKFNAPGGRLEPGETPLQAAVREVEEELCITPHNPVFCGELRFQFVDGLSIHGFVYRSDSFSGTPQRTYEATPVWVRKDRIPFSNMWADDRVWMDWMLSERTFDARFIFDNETMLDSHIE